MYTFTNQFSSPSLRQRIGMMNGHHSGSLAWWRYVIWTALMGVMAIACRHTQTTDEVDVTLRDPAFPLTNATRVLANELDQQDMPWFRQSSLLTPYQPAIINGRRVTRVLPLNYPEILCLRNNQLSLKNTSPDRVKVFINGQASIPSALSILTFEEVEDLLVYEKWDDALNADKYPESYRLFISTTHKTPTENPTRIQWKQYLLANAISDYPLGKSGTFSMNKLLEAAFFQNKLAFVSLTKDNHLKLYDEFATDIDLYINGLPVDKKNIEAVHVREVDKLYTRERHFQEWAYGPNRTHRYIMYVQTSPKRAKRDSSYYVFSPFYSGDF
jgi:hypothetical protein